MPVVFGTRASTVEEIVTVFERYGDRVRGTYRAHYRFDQNTSDAYAVPRLERPDSLRDNPPNAIFPWEQVFLAAAACAGSDYPMLAAHYGIPLESVDFVVEGVFDPRGEFDGLAGFAAPEDARHCYRSLHFRVTMVSPAPREALETIHERALAYNMVVGALRGIPQTNELLTLVSRVPAEAMAGGVQ